MAPTAARAIKKEDSDNEYSDWSMKYNMKSLRSIWVAGERCDPKTISYLRKRFNKPVLDNYWQTETGWPVTAPMIFDGDQKNATPIRIGSAGKPCPGWNLVTLNPDTNKQVCKQLADLFVKLPLPPGSKFGLFNSFRMFCNTLEQ